MAVTVRGDRGAFGGVLTPPQAGPLRLGALSARAASSALLSVGPNGDVVAGALAAADLPSVFTRRDVAETIGETWTWAPGKAIVFSAGDSPAPPLLTGRSTGTRVVVHPHTGGTTEYAIGIDSGALWQSTPLGQTHKWYSGATERLRLDATGTLTLLNGSGTLNLSEPSLGNGRLEAPGSLDLAAGTALYLSTGAASNLIVPVTGYKENLGTINRKYLSLHAAELWVETLVAQDTLATIGGRIVVGATTTLTRDLAPSATTIYVKHNAFELDTGDEHGSKLVLQAAGKFETLWVTSATVPAAQPQGDYAYTVQRDVTVPGTVGGVGSPWYAGDAVFDTGKLQTGGAFIDLYSVKGLNPGTSAGPTIVGNVRIGHWGTEWREHWAIGNLKGVYGNTGRVMGAAFGDTNGIHLQIDAVNGIRFLGGGGTSGLNYGQWDTSGNLSLGYASGGQFVFSAATGNVSMRFNGVEKIGLRSDGSVHLSAGLVVGADAGAVGYVRSAGATDWNAGNGFVFKYTQATTATSVLIGNSAGRRLQWTPTGSLVLVSDGLQIDENGITLQQQNSATYSPTRAIQWSGGARMWDSSTTDTFELNRFSGYLNIVAYSTLGAVMLQGGGAGADRTTLTLRQASMEFGGVLTGGTRPPFLPANDQAHNLGSASRRWNEVYAFMTLSQYGQFAGSNFGYYLFVAADAAGKPTTGTWTITPSDGRAKDDIVPVDREAALALVQRVPLVRFRYTGALGSPADVRGIGVVAQDIAPLLPASVHRDPAGTLGWNPHELLMLNVAAVQALATRLAALERTPRDS
jgi:Chaperone of endosialidase